MCLSIYFKVTLAKYVQKQADCIKADFNQVATSSISLENLPVM